MLHNLKCDYDDYNVYWQLLISAYSGMYPSEVQCPLGAGRDGEVDSIMESWWRWSADGEAGSLSLNAEGLAPVVSTARNGRHSVGSKTATKFTPPDCHSEADVSDMRCKKPSYARKSKEEHLR
jgi:hypothetical protein